MLIFSADTMLLHSHILMKIYANEFSCREFSLKSNSVVPHMLQNPTHGYNLILKGQIAFPRITV